VTTATLARIKATLRAAPNAAIRAGYLADNPATRAPTRSHCSCATFKAWSRSPLTRTAPVPFGGHAVFIDARAMLAQIDPLAHPGQALACAPYSQPRRLRHFTARFAPAR
jgi:hypothetical protein